MTKKELPTLNAVYLLVTTFDALESGNAKEATETLASEFREIANQNPAEYFRILQNASYDRPSAWWSYAAIVKLPRRLADLELAMHATGEDRKVREKLNRYFFDTFTTKARGREAFKILFSRNWDT